LLTTNQIRNVLRVYGNELKRMSRISTDGLRASARTGDFVEISLEARKRQMLSEISTNLISKVIGGSYQQRAYSAHSMEGPFQEYVGGDSIM
jgi:hypothetical protein